MNASAHIQPKDTGSPIFIGDYEHSSLGGATALLLRHYRKTHHLTQIELGVCLLMSQPQIGRLEAGVHNPSSETLARIAERLDLNLVVSIHPGAAGQPTSFHLQAHDHRLADTP